MESLKAFLTLGPGQLAPSQDIPNALQLPPLLACFERVLLSIPLREADVLRQRWASDGTRRTLEDVGSTMGVTRERIRQIEAKSIRKLSQEHPWLASIGPRISSLLSQRDDPLYLDLLEVEDHWFAGSSMQVPLFENLLTNFGDEMCHVIEVNHRRILCKLSQEQWELAHKDILSRLSERVDDGLGIHDIAIIVEAALPGAPELVDLMLGQIAENLRYSTDAQGEKILASVGRRETTVVNAILNESLGAC